MAKLSVTLIICSLVISMLYANVTSQDPNLQDSWVQTLSQANKKFTSLHFYVQDALAGPNQTVYEVARASITSTSPTTFGQVIVIDDLITALPDRNSTKLGRAQGLITSSDLVVPGLTMNINFYFNSGEYNGSTLCILGRNQILSANREFAVVGGTGAFRMSHGYSISNTYSYDPVESYGILEYNIYITYFD